jgi:tetratricopeptide (TPR) repeat protein
MGARLFLRSTTAALTALSLALPAGAAAPARPKAGAGPLDIRVGEAKDLSHIEFRWSGAVKMGSRRDGQDLILTFNRQAQPDLSRLRVDPPRFLKTTEVRTTGGGLEVIMHLTPDADAKVGWGDGAPMVSLFPRKDPPPAPPAPPPPRPNPAPASGVVPVLAQVQGQQLNLSFTWKLPVAAAVFRRGEAVWIVFDGKARLAMPALPKGGPALGAIQQIQGADFTALRIPAASTVPFNAFGQGPNWTVVLGPSTLPRPTPVVLGRDRDAAPAALSALVAGSSRAIWITDPVVRDKIAVVTALGPAKGLPIRRDFVELTALPSVQGLAVESGADDLSLTTDGDIVRISRPHGLKLSLSAPVRVAGEPADTPKAAAMPGLVDYAAWARTGPGGFLPRYDALVTASAQEVDRESQGNKTVGVEARMALARFLVGSELNFEAIGVLDSTARKHPEVLNNAEFRGLRGAARAMAGRFKEAQADFSAPILADDPASALWRGYAAARLGQWIDARTEFQKGVRVQDQVDPKWRATFARADAEAAMNLGDYTTAGNEIALALNLPQSAPDQLADRLLQARMMEATGAPERALGIFDAVATAPIDSLATEATLHATQIRLNRGSINPTKAAAILDGLRYRWRGDAVELDVIRGLGQVYLNEGRYREALEALRSAGSRLPDLPQAIQLQADLAGAFRSLFLDGLADGMQPVQALALFYDFKTLTPVGADGDEMVRKLARRLVDVDLLDQAAELLKYQADNRLDGVPRAQVATDLATIDLMARRPEQALDALNSSRNTLLPTALQSERRVIESRAWLQLNQLDHAQEILGKDASPEANDMRAEVAWKRRDWPAAGKLFEAGIADRSKTPELPLNGDEEAKLLRAAICYSLAGDDASLTRLRDHFGGFVEHARQPDALRVALTGLNGGQIGAADLARAVSEDQSFAGWVARMKARLREKPELQLRPAAPPLKAPPLKTAQAAAAKPTAKG